MTKKDQAKRTAAEESVKDLSGALPTEIGSPKRDRAGAKQRRGARKEQPAKPAKPGMPGSVNDSRRCTATAHRTGERCRAPAITGANVCRVHGGSAPQVRKSAKERLLELADPAIAALSKIVRDEDADDSVRLRAALGIMDRVGLGPGQTIEIGVSKFDDLLTTLVTEPGMTDIKRDLPPGADKRALGVGAGEHPWEDYEQHATDAREEAWREYDHEDAEAVERGRIRPDENTVPGEVVVGRYDVAPDLGPTDPPRYWDEEARREGL